MLGNFGVEQNKTNTLYSAPLPPRAVAGVTYINYGKLWRHTLRMIFWSLKHLFFF